MTLKFGWCLTGHHDSCRTEIGSSHGITRCECDCHYQTEVRDD